MRDYNASLPAVVEAQKKAGKRIALVDMEAAISENDLLSDGVHPNQLGMEKMAEAWFEAITTPTPETTATPSPQPPAQ